MKTFTLNDKNSIPAIGLGTWKSRQGNAYRAVNTAYSPLGSLDRPESMKQRHEPPLLDNETVKVTAAKEGLTSAQLLIAWAINRGTSVIPKSSNPERIAENLAAASPHSRPQLKPLSIR